MAKKKSTSAPKTKTKPAAKPAPVDAIKHQDSRTNIPTCETAALVADDEAAPKTVLYPRDPSLDPQLVWKGKDKQDAKALEVPAVPIYIQEKIQPQAIIEDLRRRAASLPFDAPKKGKVAVKVINHYGDEVLKVFRAS